MIHPLNVLVVEDNPRDAEMLARELKRSGFNCNSTRAETEEQFLAALKESPDLILSDFSLPQFNGLQAFLLMQQSGKEIPFILISGTVGEDVAVEAMRLGVADYLLKDRLERLGSAVTRALELSRMRAMHSEAQTKLRIQERAIQAASQGIIITDALQTNCPIIYANHGFELISGYSVADSIGKNCHFLQGIDTDAKAIDSIRDAIADESAVSVEMLNYRKDGSAFWNKFSITPVRNDAGIVTHFVGVQIDVTAQRSMEEQLRQSQKMDAIGQLSGEIAHEFNNLLTVISGYTELLLAPVTETESSWKYLTEIQTASDRAAYLTRRLLAFGHRDVRTPESINLNFAVTDTAKFISRLLGDEFEVDVVLYQNLGQTWADLGQVSQVLINLVLNARDSMDSNGRITIRTDRLILKEPRMTRSGKRAAGNYVLLSVTDTGCGMNHSVVDRIFEPFFTTKSAGRGTGLGLSIVQGIVSQSEGFIDVVSVEGEGSTFHIALPEFVQQTKGLQAPCDTQVTRTGNATILLVEDDASLRRLAEILLASYGYSVLLAADGNEAIRIVAECDCPIDLMITDVVMPGMNGQELAEQITEKIPGIRVLFMSGNIPSEEVRASFMNPEISFLKKPFALNNLALKVKEVLAS